MKKLIACLLVVLMAMSLVACGSKEETPANSGSDTPASIKLGGSGPLTGAAAVYGNDVKNAAQLAVDEINAKEGYNFFEFNFQDDEADPTKAPNAYGTLVDWGMQVSIYTTTSGAGLAVAQDYYNNRIFAITPSGSNPGLVYSADTNYDNLFQVCFTDPNQGVASANYISEHKLGSKIAIIYRSDDDYSTSIYNTFKSEADKLGLEIVYAGAFVNTDSDYSTQLTAAQAAGADLVFIPIYYDPASIILTQANQMGYAPTFFAVDGLDGILGIEGFDASLAEGCYLLTPFAADATDDKTVSFVSSFESKFGTTPTQFAADAYDAVYAIYEACKAAGVTGDMEASEICDLLIAQFTSMTFEGLTGTCTWSANGEVSKTPKAVIISGGVYVAAE